MKVKRVGEMDHEQPMSAQERVGDDLDRALDAALAQYARVEPRVGLEQRILANLLAKQTEVPHAAWRRWGLAGFAIAVLIVAVAVGWKSGTTTPSVIADHPWAIPRSSRGPETQVAGGDLNPIRPERQAANRKAIVHPSPATVAAAATPKLDQFPSPVALNAQDRFPSPRPLTEQEKILASYVTQFPMEAALIARAQTELAEREEKEELEEYGPAPAGAVPKNQPQFDGPKL